MQETIIFMNFKRFYIIIIINNLFIVNFHFIIYLVTCVLKFFLLIVRYVEEIVRNYRDVL